MPIEFTNNKRMHEVEMHEKTMQFINDFLQEVSCEIVPLPVTCPTSVANPTVPPSSTFSLFLTLSSPQGHLTGGPQPPVRSKPQEEEKLLLPHWRALDTILEAAGSSMSKTLGLVANSVLFYWICTNHTVKV